MADDPMAKRARIHPTLACVGIGTLGAIAIAAKIAGHDNPILIEETIIGVIALILGIKVRSKLPVT